MQSTPTDGHLAVALRNRIADVLEYLDDVNSLAEANVLAPSAQARALAELVEMAGRLHRLARDLQRPVGRE
jgi:hypothetical protein